jgi:hypothetical protein
MASKSKTSYGLWKELHICTVQQIGLLFEEKPKGIIWTLKEMRNIYIFW